MSLASLEAKLKPLAAEAKLKLLAYLTRTPLTAEELVAALSAPVSTVRKYLRELEEGGYVERVLGERLRFRARPFQLRISLEEIAELHEAASRALTHQIVQERGTAVLRKLRQLGPAVRSGQLSIYDVAHRLGVTYLEAYSLLEEAGLLSAS